MKKVILLSFITTAVLFANETKTLQEIVVTAQKTKENANEVPIAMSVFDELGLEDKKVENLVNLSYFVPNFYLADSGDWGVFAPSLRGIYATATLLSSSVGLYIDGVPSTNSVGFEAILDDIERIEVLRGPQGTLYGKNTEAGVINVITKKPGNNPSGKIGLEYGEDNKQKLNLSLKTPIIKDKLFIGFNGQYYSKNGNIKNTYLNTRANDRKNYYGKMYLRATPTDKLELALIASKQKRDDGRVSYTNAPNLKPRELQSGFKEFMKNSNDIYAFKINYDFDFMRLESTTSYSKYNQLLRSDNDEKPVNIYDIKGDIDYKTLSQEIKLDGEIENLKWLLGIFGSEFEKTGGWDYRSDDPKINTGLQANKIKDKGLGIFTHLNYAFTNKLNLLAGVRYDRDKSDIDDPVFGYKDSFKTNNISPKIAIEYKLTPNVMTYASVAKGYKAGGFYMYAKPSYPKKYDSESLVNYEIGTKTNFLNNRLMLNAAIYYMDLKDMQMITYVDDFSAYVSNAPKAKSYGFELDGSFAFNQNLSFFGSFGYSEAKFDEFSDFKGKYNNNYKPYAPKFTYSLGSTFRGFGGFYASANVKGYSKMYSDNANLHEYKAYALVDSKIGYEWDKFDIYLYANNIFSKNYDMINAEDGRSNIIFPDREIGVKLAYRF